MQICLSKSETAKGVHNDPLISIDLCTMDLPYANPCAIDLAYADLFAKSETAKGVHNDPLISIDLCNSSPVFRLLFSARCAIFLGSGFPKRGNYWSSSLTPS